MLLVAGNLFSQRQYDFNMSKEAYQPLTNGTLLVTDPTSWDDPDIEFQLPFAYNWEGLSFTHIEFDNYSPAIILTKGRWGDTILSLNFLPGDLISRGVFSSNQLSPVRYKIDGNTGQRILKVEWENVGFYDTDADDSMSFQLWLFEQSSDIQWRVGPSGFTDFDDSFNGYVGPRLGIIGPVDDFTNALIGFEGYLDGSASAPSWIPNISTSVPYLIGFPADSTVFTFSLAYPTSVQPQRTDVDLTIWPSPAKAELHIDYAPRSTEYSLHVIDYLGKRIINQRASSQASVNVANLPAGTYLLEIIDGKERFRRSFVKQ